jgi:UDP-N-acetylglucosamine 4-epimerase
MLKESCHKNGLSDCSFLVTGGAGFIGSNLVECLLAYGAKHVRVLDNFITGYKKNIEPFMKNPHFALIVGDIRNLTICREAVQGMDYVLHEAALGSVPRSINDPITSNEINISGFLNMLIASRDAKIRRFVYAASSSTYGDSTELPKREDRIGRPLSPYAVTKYTNELYANVFSQLYGLETVGLRYFNVFGQRQDPKSAYAAVIPKFIIQLVNHESPIINGDGNYSRDFTYVKNVVQINLLAALTDKKDAINQIYNVACGEQTTLNKLAYYLKRFLGVYDDKIKEMEFIYGPNRAGDIPHSLASIEKAKKLLGYAPQFDLETGLKFTVEWYWNNLVRKK